MPTCKERWAEHKNSTVKHLRKLWALYQEDSDAYDPDLGSFPEYGLGFDYVPAHTFTDQPRGYFRYQISWGGPSSEFRFLTENPRNPRPEIAYAFMDWFDGYTRRLRGKDLELLTEIWGAFFEDLAIDAVRHAEDTGG